MLTVQTIINAPVHKVWQYYNSPEHITKWNQADPSWHCPKSVVDLRVGGKFSNTMAARDGSASFDFAGEFTEVLENKSLKYTFGPRKAEVVFNSLSDSQVEVIVSFDPETENPHDLQISGWQSILNNFKVYTESN